jgi:ferredoxin-like protein FixX
LKTNSNEIIKNKIENKICQMKLKTDSNKFEHKIQIKIKKIEKEIQTATRVWAACPKSCISGFDPLK